MRKFIYAVPALLFAMHFPAVAQMDRVPRGTEVVVRTNEPIHLREWDRGRIYSGQLDRDVLSVEGNLAFPRGTPVELIVRQVGEHEMALDLESINANGRRYVVDATTEDYNTRGERQGVGENRRTGKYVGGGAIIGSIIGAIAGGGKGAAIGAAAGAAAGAGAQMATRGSEIHVPAESLVTFRLESGLRYAEGPDNGYNRDGRHYHDYRQ